MLDRYILLSWESGKNFSAWGLPIKNEYFNWRMGKEIKLFGRLGIYLHLGVTDKQKSIEGL